MANKKNTKKKTKVILLLLIISAYLAMVMSISHEEWKKGITPEQIEREDMLIW